MKDLRVFLRGTAATLVALVLGSCGGPVLVYDQPEAGSSGRWETAWIDPEVVLTDSVFTLIRAETVDSFYVDRPGRLPTSESPSVEFKVSSPECFTAVNLMDSYARVKLPVLAKNLSPGFYKLTLDFHQLSAAEYPPGDYVLKVDVCGFKLARKVRRDL